MRLADQASAVASLLEILPDTMPILNQLRSKRPCTMLARILPCNDGRSTRCAGRIRTIGSAERRPFSRQTVKIRRLDLRKKSPYRIPVLLIACNQKNIWSLLTHSRYTPSLAYVFGYRSPWHHKKRAATQVSSYANSSTFPADGTITILQFYPRYQSIWLIGVNAKQFCLS